MVQGKATVESDPAPHEVSGEALLQAWLDGDESKAEVYIERRKKQLGRLVHNLLPSMEDVKEIVQDSFERLLREVKKKGTVTTPDTFLNVIAFRQAISRLRLLRSRRTGAHGPLKDHQGEAPDPLRGRYVSPINYALFHEIRRVAKELGPETEEICWALIDDMPYKELSQRLRLSVGAIKQRVRRLRIQLRSRLDAGLPQVAVQEPSDDDQENER